MAYSDLRKGRISEIGLVYHITAVTLNREPFFASLENGRKLVCELMRLEREARVETLCYVLMPDHLHWLMVLRQGELSEAVQLMKGRTAHALKGAVWQPNYFDHAIRKNEDLRKIARYIVANPIRAGLVPRIEEYSHWDAVWLNETLSG